MKKPRIIAISDLHNLYRTFDTSTNTWKADIIICAGDMTSGRVSQVIDFLEWYSSLDIPHKILIAGNHDWSFQEWGYEDSYRLCKEYGIEYLENTSCEILGLKFFGSPFSNQFYNWAFMTNEKELSKIYSKIPEDTDIIISHGPPYKILDFTYDQCNAGSKSLKERIPKLNVKACIFGHIHESFGYKKVNEIHYYNVSSYNYYEYMIEKVLKDPVIIEF